jgi:hypothetical protein
LPGFTTPSRDSLSRSRGGTSSVNFQFQTSGVVITTGTLNIGIGVTEVDGGTGQACTPFAPNTCPANQWCGPSGTGAACQTGGTGTQNAMCTAAVPCANNFICVTQSATMSGLCKQACQPGATNGCMAGTVCTPFQGSMLFGACI